MAYPRKVSVTVTTASDGTVTGYTEAIRGRIVSVIYVKDDFADGVDFTITTEDTLQDVWVDTDINATETVHPRVIIHDTAGVPLIYDDAVANLDQVDYIRAVHERIKIVIGSGGDTKSGTFTIIYE